MIIIIITNFSPLKPKEKVSSDLDFDHKYFTEKHKLFTYYHKAFMVPKIYRSLERNIFLIFNKNSIFYYHKFFYGRSGQGTFFIMPQFFLPEYTAFRSTGG